MTYPEQAPVPEPRKRKGGALIIVGIIAMLLGLVFGGFGVANGVYQTSQANDTVKKLQRIECPGSRIVYLKAGKRDVFAELPSSESGTPYAEVRISNARTGDEVTVASSNASITYTMSGRSGKRIGIANIPADDQYLIEASGEGADAVAVGNFSPVGFIASIFGIVGGLCCGGLSFIVGLVLLIVGLVKRAGSKPTTI